MTGYSRFKAVAFTASEAHRLGVQLRGESQLLSVVVGLEDLNQRVQSLFSTFTLSAQDNNVAVLCTQGHQGQNRCSVHSLICGLTLSSDGHLNGEVASCLSEDSCRTCVQDNPACNSGFALCRYVYPLIKEPKIYQ